jgi:membrane protein DedA with SNARE-associated domain
MEITGQDILIFMKDYGYWIILPLMIIEGPVATIIAAMLASAGVFNVFVVFTFSMLGDIIGDVLFYLAGSVWGMGFVRRVGKYIGITEGLVLKMENYFKNHGGKTIFLVKSTTGLCWATFTAAGVVKMNFWKFLRYSALGGVVWSGFLVLMGYFYGYMWQEISEYIKWAGWIVLAVAVASFVIINLYKSKKTKRIFG